MCPAQRLLAACVCVCAVNTSVLKQLRVRVYWLLEEASLQIKFDSFFEILHVCVKKFRKHYHYLMW